MSLGPFGIFAMRTGAAWRYRLFAIIPGGFGALMALVVIATEVLHLQSEVAFMIFFILYTVFALVFIPYAVYAIEKSLGFLLGDNLLVFDGAIFFLLKLLKYAIAGFFLPILVPIGMMYVRNENMNALGQMEAEAMMARAEEEERQKAAEAAELARKQEIREEAIKLAKEMRDAES